jgi:hypothetical protein
MLSWGRSVLNQKTQSKWRRGAARRRNRQRGAIDELPSGALRVRIYAGIDPISRRRMYLSEVVPPESACG